MFFMRGINTFSVIYIDFFSRLSIDAGSSNFMQENMEYLKQKLQNIFIKVSIVEPYKREV